MHDVALAQANQEVNLGLLGFADRVGPLDAVELIYVYSDTQTLGSPAVQMKRLQTWCDRRGFDRGDEFSKLANIYHDQKPALYRPLCRTCPNDSGQMVHSCINSGTSANTPVERVLPSCNGSPNV